MMSVEISNDFQALIHESTHLHSYKYPRISRVTDWREHCHKHSVNKKAFASLALANEISTDLPTFRPETQSRPLPLAEKVDQFSISTNIWTGIRKGQHIFWKERWQEAEDWPDRWWKPINPYATPTFLLFITVTSNVTAAFCHWAARYCFMKGRCWHWADLAMADVAGAGRLSKGTFASPSRVQPPVSLPSNLFYHTYFTKPTFFFSSYVFLKE